MVSDILSDSSNLRSRPNRRWNNLLHFLLRQNSPEPNVVSHLLFPFRKHCSFRVTRRMTPHVSVSSKGTMFSAVYNFLMIELVEIWKECLLFWNQEILEATSIKKRLFKSPLLNFRHKTAWATGGETNSHSLYILVSGTMWNLVRWTK